MDKSITELLELMEPRKVYVFIAGCKGAEIPEKEVQLASQDIIPYVQDTLGKTVSYLKCDMFNFYIEEDGDKVPTLESVQNAKVEYEMIPVEEPMEEEYVNLEDELDSIFGE